MPRTLTDLNVPELVILRTGNAVFKIIATAERADAAGEHEFTYENRYEPATSLWMANVFLQPAGGSQYEVTGQERSSEGGRLTVTCETLAPCDGSCWS